MASSRRRLRGLEEKLAEINTEAESADQEMVELGLEHGHLAAIEDRRRALDQLFQHNKGLWDKLDAAATQCVEQVPAIRKAERAAGSASVFRWLSLLLSLICSATWALLSLTADWGAARELESWFKAAVPNWQDSYVPIIGYAGLGFLLSTLLFWMRTGQQTATAAKLRVQAGQLADPLAKVQALEAAQGLEVPAVRGKHFDLPDSLPATNPNRPAPAQFEAVLPRIQSGRASASESSQIADCERDWLQHLLECQSRLLHNMDQAFEEETERVQQAATLHEVIESLKERKHEIRDRIAQRKLASELLEGAARQSSRHFNRDIRDLIGHTLLSLTARRYEHLKISEALSVQAFSAEKRDFLELDEVSNGTQRQTMLALRLALSEKLLNRTVKGDSLCSLTNRSPSSMRRGPAKHSRRCRYCAATSLRSGSWRKAFPRACEYLSPPTSIAVASSIAWSW